MFGKILFISDNNAHVELIKEGKIIPDLMNLQVIFENDNQRIMGEIKNISENKIEIKFLGEFENDKYIPGVLKKPALTSTVRIINEQELGIIVGNQDGKSLLIGYSPLYNKFPIHVDVNSLFSNHLAVFGNSGSGKSCGIARIVQNIFANPNVPSFNSNLFFFDAYGEYKNAFKSISQYNPNYQYKFITTSPEESGDTSLSIPFYLLDLDDIALLLQASDHSQLTIIERAINYAKIFSQNDALSIKYKNHLIAKGILAVLFSNQTTASKKNDVFSLVTACATPEFNYNVIMPGIGYTRKFSECFNIDSKGNFGESVLINEYVMKHIDESTESITVPETANYKIEDFANALNFTLISEGFLSNNKLQDAAMMLKVRLGALINSSNKRFFEFPEYITKDKYISYLVAFNNKRSQIININLQDIDDILAKTIVKIFVKFLFGFTKTRKQRASIPFHIFLEESHRYIQNDSDKFLLGYNIFDRVAKEGRKYGLLLDLISQRPVEISDTVVSQISNFFIFKMTHPLDLEYIGKMLPNMSADVLEKLNTLQPGTCVAFGSAFKVPMIVKLEMPNPEPYSANADVIARWKNE